jgi:hypothetical protein
VGFLKKKGGRENFFGFLETSKKFFWAVFNLKRERNFLLISFIFHKTNWGGKNFFS